MKKLSQLLKWVVPFVVSGGFLYYEFITINMGSVLEQITSPVLFALVPALLLYGAVSLWIEARTLIRILWESGHTLDLWTTARIKAASYLLYIVHYTLGAGGLSLLLRRRAGVRLGDAGGAVVLIALFDMSILIVLAGISAVFHRPGDVLIPSWIIALAALAMASGFVVLRLPWRLGPLDRLRFLSIFDATRTASGRLLADLAVLRFAFVVTFMAICGAALWAFEIHLPLRAMVMGIAIVAVVATLPIAVAGLGTSQAAFIAVFAVWADKGTLLACSLTLSAGFILLRAGMGFLFSGEYVREAFGATRHVADLEES